MAPGTAKRYYLIAVVVVIVVVGIYVTFNSQDRECPGNWNAVNEEAIHASLCYPEKFRVVRHEYFEPFTDECSNTDLFTWRLSSEDGEQLIIANTPGDVGRVERLRQWDPNMRIQGDVAFQRDVYRRTTEASNDFSVVAELIDESVEACRSFYVMLHANGESAKEAVATTDKIISTLNIK